MIDLKRHKEILSLPNVTLVGKGKEGKEIIGTSNKVDVHALAWAYPAAKIVYTGKIWALQARTERHRPAPGGVSIGHHLITAGTLGSLTPDGMILSNNHVLANSNVAQIGDPILQPGPYDGGTSKDELATLAAFVPIQFYQDDNGDGDCPFQKAYVWLGNTVARLFRSMKRVKGFSTDIPFNYVDAALADPRNPLDVKNEILEVGPPMWLANPQPTVGQIVKKSGRTTGLTTSTITMIEASVAVGYGGNRTAYFMDQIIFDNPQGKIIAGGDSGSILLDVTSGTLGLCFAGSDTIGIANHIKYVRDALKF